MISNAFTTWQPCSVIQEPLFNSHKPYIDVSYFKDYAMFTNVTNLYFLMRYFVQTMSRLYSSDEKLWNEVIKKEPTNNIPYTCTLYNIINVFPLTDWSRPMTSPSLEIMDVWRQCKCISTQLSSSIHLLSYQKHSTGMECTGDRSGL